MAAGTTISPEIDLFTRLYTNLRSKAAAVQPEIPTDVLSTDRAVRDFQYFLMNPDFERLAYEASSYYPDIEAALEMDIDRGYKMGEVNHIYNLPEADQPDYNEGLSLAGIVSQDKINAMYAGISRVGAPELAPFIPKDDKFAELLKQATTTQKYELFNMDTWDGTRDPIDVAVLQRDPGIADFLAADLQADAPAFVAPAVDLSVLLPPDAADLNGASSRLIPGKVEDFLTAQAEILGNIAPGIDAGKPALTLTDIVNPDNIVTAGFSLPRNADDVKVDTSVPDLNAAVPQHTEGQLQLFLNTYDNLRARADAEIAENKETYGEEYKPFDPKDPSSLYVNGELNYGALDETTQQRMLAQFIADPDYQKYMGPLAEAMGRPDLMPLSPEEWPAESSIDDINIVVDEIYMSIDSEDAAMLLGLGDEPRSPSLSASQLAEMKTAIEAAKANLTREGGQGGEASVADSVFLADPRSIDIAKQIASLGAASGEAAGTFVEDLEISREAAINGLQNLDAPSIPGITQQAVNQIHLDAEKTNETIIAAVVKRETDSALGTVDTASLGAADKSVVPLGEVRSASVDVDGALTDLRGEDKAYIPILPDAQLADLVAPYQPPAKQPAIESAAVVSGDKLVIQQDKPADPAPSVFEGIVLSNSEINIASLTSNDAMPDIMPGTPSVYVVEAGDSLSKIAYDQLIAMGIEEPTEEQFDNAMDNIALMNADQLLTPGPAKANLIITGQALLIPGTAEELTQNAFALDREALDQNMKDVRSGAAPLGGDASTQHSDSFEAQCAGQKTNLACMGKDFPLAAQNSYRPEDMMIMDTAYTGSDLLTGQKKDPNQTLTANIP